MTTNYTPEELVKRIKDAIVPDREPQNFGTCGYCNGPLDIDHFCIDVDCKGYDIQQEASHE